MKDWRELKPGDRVYRWVWTGTTGGGEYDTSDIQELTVIRVNRKTVTVRTDVGSVGRLEPHHLRGRIDWEED